MEIITTMVRFAVPSVILEQTTQKAQWFSFGPHSAFKDVSVPLSKIAIRHSENGQAEVVMPKWVYMKYPALQGYINDQYEQFSHTYNVDNDSFFN